MSTSHPVAPRVRRTMRRYLIVGAGLILFVLAAMLEHVIGDVAIALIAAPAAALVLWFCFTGFAGLDEVAQRAHYVAWFWGGSIGLAALPLLGILAVPFGFWDGGLDALSVQMWGEATHETGFFTGVLIALAPALAGYTVWWLVFWLRRR